MINLGRVGNNALTLLILMGVGYWIFLGIKNRRIKAKLENMLGGFKE